MAQPYVGEIRMFAGNFAPAGWAHCDGQLLPISENETLFQLIGTTYGGDGQSTFALPNLQSRIPIHMGQGAGLSNRILAETGGAEQVTLTVNQTPAHTHAMLGSLNIGQQSAPAGNMPARTIGADIYARDTPNINMAASVVSAVGGSQPHDNMQPFLCVNFIISLFGIFPQPA